MPTRIAQWNSDTQFNFGSPTKSNVEVIGSGDSAYLGLAKKTGSSDDIPFTTSANYTYDDTKIEIANEVAKLKPAAGGDNNWSFTTSGNYTFDGAKIEVTGGVARLKGIPLNPYAWYHLNESSGTNVPDSSGNGRNGTTQNMEDADWVTGKLNNCLQFDGVNEWINCGNIASFEKTDEFSFEGWFKLQNTDGHQRLFKKGGVLQGFNIYWNDGTEELRFFIRDANSNVIQVATSIILDDDNYHHIVVTYDGSSTANGMHIYIDNIENSYILNNNTLTGTTVNSEYLNISTSIDTIKGQVDEIVIYDQELSASYVNYRYNGGAGTELMPDTYAIDNPDVYPNSGYAFATVLGVFTETSTKPAGSGIKHQISSDNGATWKWWNGAAWTAITGGQTDSWYYASESNVASIINSNISTLASSGVFKFRAFMHSDVGIVTPELDNIYVAEDVVYPLGNHEIAMNTDIDPAEIFAWLSVVETFTIPANTTVLRQYSVNSGGSWNESWLTLTQLETAMQSMGSPDKIRLKWQLSTTDINVTPELDNVEITSSAGYESSGYYESFAYQPEDNTNGVYLDSVSFYAETPSGTGLSIEVRHVDHPLEVGYKPYNSGDDIKYCGNIIQFKATMISTGENTPKLNWLRIYFHALVGVLRSIDNTISSGVETIDRVDLDVDIIRKISENKITRNGDIITIYEDDNVTVWKKFDLSLGGRVAL